MSEDFHKGTQNDSSNVSNPGEFYRGQEYQRAANAPRAATSPHGPSGFTPMVSGTGMVITGENPILQLIVSIPFLVVGTALYPVTLAATVVAGLLCTRLVPLFGVHATWERWLAYVPMLVVFWFCMRWDIRIGERNALYRRVRHAVRIGVFALAGYFLAARYAPLYGMPGAVIGAALGNWFLLRGERWREFWHHTLWRFRLRPAY